MKSSFLIGAVYGLCLALIGGHAHSEQGTARTGKAAPKAQTTIRKPPHPSMPPGQFGIPISTPVAVDPSRLVARNALPISPPWKLRRPTGDLLGLAEHFPSRWDMTIFRGSRRSWTQWIELRRSATIARLEEDLKALEREGAELEREIDANLRMSAILQSQTTASAMTFPKPLAESKQLLTALNSFQLRQAYDLVAAYGNAYDILRAEQARLISDSRRDVIPKSASGPFELTQTSDQAVVEFQSTALRYLTPGEVLQRARDIAWQVSGRAWDHRPALRDHLLGTPLMSPGDAPIGSADAEDLPVVGADSIADGGGKSTPRLVTPDAPSVLGITVPLDRGTTICVPLHGEVLYAGNLRGWDHALILQQEGSRSLVLTGLSSLLVKTGDQIQPGKPLGIAGGPLGVSVRIRSEETAVETLLGSTPPIQFLRCGIP